MKKCVQTVNRFGYPMEGFVCDAVSFHDLGWLGSKTCQTSQRNCCHHEPDYEDFNDWVEYTRSQNEVLPD